MKNHIKGMIAEYLEITGKPPEDINNLSVKDYLLFRKQAIKECGCTPRFVQEKRQNKMSVQEILQEDPPPVPVQKDPAPERIEPPDKRVIEFPMEDSKESADDSDQRELALFRALKD